MSIPCASPVTPYGPLYTQLTSDFTPPNPPANPQLLQEPHIYLHRLDNFVETVLLPEYTRGKDRRKNPAYRKVQKALTNARERGDRAEARALRKQQRNLPSKDLYDPDYRRLRYTRYADDTLLGFIGPKPEAEEIKQRLAAFLRDDLKLELSPEKTLITHARTGAARFLGYESPSSTTTR